MLAMFEQVLILLIFCVIGYVLCKVKLVNPDHSKVLSVLLVYILFPFMSFNTFSAKFNITYLQEKGLILLVSIGLLTVVTIVTKFLRKFLGGDPY